VVHFYDLRPVGTAMTDDPTSQGMSGPWSTMTPIVLTTIRSTVQWLEDNAELAKQEAWLAKKLPKEWLAKHPGKTLTP
jgi:hypothetical protein